MIGLLFFLYPNMEAGQSVERKGLFMELIWARSFSSRLSGAGKADFSIAFLALVILASLFLLLGSASEGFAASGGEDDPRLQLMEFEVYTGGINAVSAELAVDEREKGRYRIIFGAKTRGFLGSLVPWKGTFESKGWVMSNGMRIPELHESIATWKKETEVKTYNYTKKGGLQNIEVKYTTKKPKTLIPDKELIKNTTDVLSATLMMMGHIARGGDCAGSFDIFDGKRRFEMAYKHKRYVMIKPTRYNAYSGPAVECEVEVKPEGGRWHKKPRGWLSIQEQGRKRGMMPTVWFAVIDGHDVAVPVRVRVKTAYGTLFMHMSKYRSGNTYLSR